MMMMKKKEKCFKTMNSKLFKNSQSWMDISLSRLNETHFSSNNNDQVFIHYMYTRTQVLT
jgi:hypothetical protein